MAEQKVCVDCNKEVSKNATRCPDCNAIHMKKHPPKSAVASNQKIDRNIKPYMLRRGTPSTRSGSSSMSGGTVS